MRPSLCVSISLLLAGCADSAALEPATPDATASTRNASDAVAGAGAERSGAPRERTAATGASQDLEPGDATARPRAVNQSRDVSSVTPAATLVDRSGAAGTSVERRGRSEPAGRVYRRSDDRPRHDDAALAEHGIHVYESPRLKLYADIAPEMARPLPPLIDAAYDEWVRYFGPLPPNREGTEYQMTGYLMADADLFRAAGLLPEEFPPFANGRHFNDRFWMHDQPFDYYRRHLMIHEATHCFMTATRDMNSLSPVWYIEGVAELFGTHRIEPDGTVRFRVMPRSADEVADYVRNLGRIEMIQRAVSEGRARSLHEALELRRRDFLNDEGYAWSWALCKLLDTHPRYRERFRGLGEQLTPRAFERAFAESFAADLDDLAVEWALFVHGLGHGYDVERSAIEFRPGTPLDGTDGRRELTVVSDRGWQSSGVRVEAGRTYRIAATGQVTLADQPRPWTSEPQGISFRYFAGRPLGLLLGAIRSEASEGGGASMLEVIPIGPGAEITPAVTGTLYLRVNDSWSELADNRGSYAVEVIAR